MEVAKLSQKTLTIGAAAVAALAVGVTATVFWRSGGSQSTTDGEPTDFTVDVQCLGTGKDVRLVFRRSGKVLTWADVLSLWSDSAPFVRSFTQALSQHGARDFFFETPALSSATRDAAFECVLLDACGDLDKKKASPAKFEQHMKGPPGGVVSFDNLRKDGRLVAPRLSKGAASRTCGSLAAFSRAASPRQVLALWKRVSKNATHMLSQSPDGTRLWVSTDGRGVPWLHVRLDTQPRYIKHAQYAR
jgi:hypothetical protein